MQQKKVQQQQEKIIGFCMLPNKIKLTWDVYNLGFVDYIVG